MRAAPFLLLTLSLALPALTSPIPQDIQGNQQMELQNVSPTPTLDAVPTATGTPSSDLSSTTNATTDPETKAMDPALQALTKPPPITADDGMKTGMGAAMAGLGSVTSGLGALPVIGGLGARDVAVTKRWALLESLPVLGPVMGSGLFGRIKRSLWPTLENMPDMGSSGFVNLGHKTKRDANLLSSLPVLGGLMGGSKTKRQVAGLDALTGLLGGLGGLGSLGGAKTKAKAKRDPALEALGEVPSVAATLLKAVGKSNRKRQILDVPIPGDIVKDVVGKVGEGVGSGGAIPGLTPRTELPIDRVKKMAAVVADIRGVTSKREAEQDDFRQGLKKAAEEKVEGALNRAEGKAERKAKDKVKDVKLPGQGAIDKREAEAEALGLDALPAKDLVEGATGLKSTMDLVKNLSSQVENRNGK